MNKLFLSVFIAALSSISLANAEGFKDEPNIFRILPHLEINTLSRFMALKQYISGQRKELRPDFGKGWIYHAKLIRNWTRRLGMYGYGLAALDSRGNGNCFFNTLYTIFRLNNITNKVLLENLNPNLKPAVYIAVKGLLEDDEPITPLNLKRVIHFMWLGMDPYDPDSVKLFDPEGIIEKIKMMAHLQTQCPNKKITPEMNTMFAGIDMIKKYNELQKGRNLVEVLKEIYDSMESKRYDGFGDYTDMNNIEYAFQMKVFMFNIVKTIINCGMRNFDYTPKLFVLMTYEDGRHYDVAGLFKLGATRADEVKSAFRLSEIPIPLLMFITEDCRLCTK